MAGKLTDPLARDLWRARTAAAAVPTDYLSAQPLSVSRAHRIAAQLYSHLRCSGDKQIGWKLGATDPATQEKLGTDRPFAAPLFESSVLSDGAVVSVAELIAPRIEMEIALSIRRGRAMPLVCIEVADCRFGTWEITISEAVADFGLQARVMFGQPVVHEGLVKGSMYANGREVARGMRSMQEARESLRFVDELTTGQAASRPGALVATGTLTPALPLTPGTWTVEFTGLGTLTLEVVP